MPFLKVTSFSVQTTNNIMTKLVPKIYFWSKYMHEDIIFCNVPHQHLFCKNNQYYIVKYLQIKGFYNSFSAEVQYLYKQWAYQLLLYC